MANQQGNRRNAAMPDENRPTWRPQDENGVRSRRMMGDDEDYRSTERYGQQSHRGKGPSGYIRSDDRIRETVCEALTEDHNVDATNLEVAVKNGEVMLSGTIENRMQKRMAEDCALQIAGVKDVLNQIRVAGEK